MLKIACYPSPTEYSLLIDALSEEAEILKISPNEISPDKLEEADVLIAECFDVPSLYSVVNFYKSCNAQIILLECGGSEPILTPYKYQMLQCCDIFRGYSLFLESIAIRLGKKIWTMPPLQTDLDTILNDFQFSRATFKYIYPTNQFHPWKFGDFLFRVEESLPKTQIYKVFGPPLDVGEAFIYSLLFRQVEIVQALPHDEFLKLMHTECKALASYNYHIQWGQCIRDAVRLGIPAFSNTYFARIFYPRLFCNSPDEVFAFLRQSERDYDAFRFDIEYAQSTMNDLRFSNAKQKARDYFFEIIQ